MIRIPNASEEFLIDTILAVNYTLRLFTNHVENGLSAAAIQGLTVANFTEAVFTGYSAKALTGGSWVSTQGDPTVGTYAQQIFAATGAGGPWNHYGWYLTRTTGGALVCYEYFDDTDFDPVVVAAIGDEIRVTPRLTLKDETSAG